MSSYNTDVIKTFSFDELYEGQVVKVNEDNSCYINVFKFFITNKSVNDVYESNISISTSNIENLNGSFNLTKLNAIICKPFKMNSSQRKMNIGDNVLVMFLNGDPQRPYYIDAYLPSTVESTSGDIIFRNNNIEISTVIDEKNPKLIIKIMDKVIEIDKDTEFNKVINNNTVQEVPGDTVIIEGTPGDVNGDLLKNYLELNSVKREFEDLKDKYKVIMSVADYYKLNNEDRKPLIESYEALVEFVEPILENMESSMEIDAELLNETFITYHKNYNKMLGDFLKIRGGNTTLTPTIVDVTDENLESVIRDMVYVVNTKTSKKFIKDIIEDGIFSVEEKKLLSSEIIKINNEYQILESLIPLHYGDNGVERLHIQYKEKYDELWEYVSPMMVDHDIDTEIGKDEFFNKFMDYFTQRLKLYAELFDYSINIYDNKKEDFDKFASDSILTLSEKKQLSEFLKVYQDEKIPFEGLCSIYGVNMKSYESSYGILETEIGNANNTTEDQKIDKTLFMKNFYTFVETRNRLLETIMSISEAYIETLMEGIHIGYTNLIYNSSFLYDTKEWSFPDYNEGFIKQVLDDDMFEKFLYTDCITTKATLTPTFFKVKKDEYLILSFYMRSSELVKLTFTINDSKNVNLSIPYTVENTNSEFTRVLVPITIIKNPDNLSLGNKPTLKIDNPLGRTFDITKLKLEFGTYDSEWSPAPEDRKYEEENFKNIIHEFSSAIIQTTDKIEMYVKEFYSKVTDTMEEIRKQSASITVELGSIEMDLTDLYQKKEQIIENLGGMEVITDTLTTHDRISRLQLDYEGIHLTVRDILNTVTNITGTIDGVLAEGGRIDVISGTLLDYHNDLQGMGGVLKKLENRMETYTTYIDGVKDSIKKIESIDQTTLTMQGSLNKIQNTLGHITGSNMLDLEFDEDGNIIKSKYIDSLNSQFSGVITKLDSVETVAKDAKEDIERYRELIGEFTEEDTKMSILEKISRLIVANDSVTTQVSKLDAAINTNETLIATDFLNNFSWTHTLDKWSPVGNLSHDEEGNIDLSSALNKLTLEKYTRDWYFGVICTDKKVEVVSDMFKIDTERMYKFSLALKDHPLNTDGKWRIGARFYSPTLINIGGYLNASDKLSTDLWFDSSPDNLVTMFRYYTGYIYPNKQKYLNDALMIKGTSENCMRFNEDALYMSLIIEYTTERGTPILYLDNPEMFEVKSMQSEQLKLIQEALIAVQPDNIMMTVKNHTEYQTDLETLRKHTESKFEIASDGISQLVSDVTVLDANGNPVKIKEEFNSVRQTLDGTVNTVAVIRGELDGMRGNLNLASGLNIMGSNIFRLSSDKVLTPESITLYGYIKDLLGSVDDEISDLTLKWYIDGILREDYTSPDSRSFTVPSTELSSKGSIKIVAKNAEESLYDEFSIVKLQEGENAISLILSNEFIGLPSSAEGTVLDYSQAFTSIDIYEGTTLSNHKWQLSVENNTEETGITGILVGRNYRVTKATKDTSSIKIIASRVIEGELIEVYKTLQIVKIKRGEAGIQGNDAYSISLSNESQSIPVRSTMYPFESKSYFTDVRVFHGATELTDLMLEIDDESLDGNLECVIYNDSSVKYVEFRTDANIKMKAVDGIIPIKVKVIDPATKATVILTKEFSWTCSLQGESAQTVDLVPETNVFKSNDGGKTYTPDTITINALFNGGCKFDSWYVSAGDKINFVKYDPKIHSGIVTTQEYFKISHDSNLFTKDITSISIKIMTNVDNMYDIVTLTKIFDRTDLDEILEKIEVAYSLIDQKTDKIEQAVIDFDKIQKDMTNNLELISKGVDKWAYEVFEEFRKDRDPGIEAIIGMSPAIINTIDDSAAVLLTGYNDKLLRFYTSVYVSKPTSISTYIRFFNKGTIYINSVRVHQLLDNSTTKSKVKLNFSTGWNTVEIVVLAGENAGVIFDSAISDSENIDTMNAFAISNDYTNSKYSYSEIEQTANSIKSRVEELDGKLGDVSSEIEQTKREWTAKFVDKGYKNYIDNGDFATEGIEGWSLSRFIPSGVTEDQAYDSASYGLISPLNKRWVGNENCIEVSVRNLKEGSYGVCYKISGLTIGENYTLCLELSGHDSEKSIFVADSNWKRYITTYKNHLNGGSDPNDPEQWAKIALEFNANEEIAYICMRISKTLRTDRPGYLWAKRIGVYVGKGWRPFMRSGNEVYSGDVRIDMNGVTVNHSHSNTYTQLNAEGLRIFSTEDYSMIASFGENGGKTASISTLMCNDLFAKNVPVLTRKSQTDYYVIPNFDKGDGSGKDLQNACSSINAALALIKETHSNGNHTSFLDKEVTIHVQNGEYNEEVYIRGLKDAGRGLLTISLAPNVIIRETFFIHGNDCAINITSKSATNVGDHENRPLLTVKNRNCLQICRNSRTVTVEGLCIEGNDTAGKAGIFIDDSRIYIQCVDFSKLLYAVSGRRCNIYSHAVRGNVKYGYYIEKGTVVYRSYSRVNSTSGDIMGNNVSASLCHNIGTIQVLDSQHNPPPEPSTPPVTTPPVTTKVVTQTFTPSRYYSTRSYTDEGQYKQGAWTSDGPSYGWWTGHASFGSNIKNFCNGGSNISMKVYMERLNTSHGYSSATPVHLCGEQTSTSLTRGQGAWINAPWSTVNALANGNELTSYYGGTLHYIRYNTNIQVQVTCTKSV